MAAKVRVVKQKHIDWFNRGARTLRAIARERGFENAFPSNEDWYLCPLCLDVMLTIDEFATGRLSVEHAPPKALGGAELVLTCRACNNDTGSKFDAEACKEERLRRLFSGNGRRTETTAFTAGGITTRVQMHVSGQTGFLLEGVPKINNPADVQRQDAYMRALKGTRNTDVSFAVTPQIRYSPDRARVSWVRTAYIAAFALFGWTYVLQRALQPVRDQLLNPSSVTLPLLSMYDSNGDPNRHEVWAIKQPAEHRSLLVISGQHSIFLPVRNDPRSLEELTRDLGAHSNGPVRYTFVGDMFPWPSKPEHLLDPEPVTAS